jgi:hypothetical protein
MRIVNISLLAKWRWRILVNDNALWKEVILNKYGDSAVGKVVIGEESKPWYASLWWKDVCSIGVNITQNWFAQNLEKKLGNGINTSFWNDNWVGNFSLKDRFPRLFSISTQKEAMVTDLYYNDNNEHWTFLWRRRFFIWEEELLDQLCALINPITLSDAGDRWGWIPEKGEDFTVSSTFSLISQFMETNLYVSLSYRPVFSAIWKCEAPSKVCAFAWQLIHDRIPNRLNLKRRQIIVDDADVLCAFWGEAAESSQHLFIYCVDALKVLKAVFNWLQGPFLLHHNLVSLFNCLIHSKGRKLRKRLTMIWNGAVWAIWRRRNAKIFYNGGKEVVEVIEEIKVQTWKWWLSHLKVSKPLLYEWQMEPILCMAHSM